MKDNASSLNQRIADRVRELRAKQRLSLDALATRSGVSRSMISLVERGESSPTAVVLERLAAGLNVPLASLFDPPSNDEPVISPIARRKDQSEWQDPATGYTRRNVSPASVPQPMRIVEVSFPPGKCVTFESSGRDALVYQQIWVLEGKIDITLGDERYQLREGDCLAMRLDGPNTFHNRTRKLARYVVVIASDLQARGRR